MSFSEMRLQMTEGAGKTDCVSRRIVSRVVGHNSSLDLGTLKRATASFLRYFTSGDIGVIEFKIV
jgi:hypothetical protein